MKRESIKKGMELLLKKDIQVSPFETIKKGTKMEIFEIEENLIYLKNTRGILGCEFDEINELFEEKKEEKVTEPIVKNNKNAYEEMGDLLNIFECDEIKHVVIFNEKTTVINKNGFIGEAICRNGEVFDKDKGIKVALIKAKIKELENELTNF